ncbi:MAG: hypothetical protein LBP59_14085 [Planctomycetaceae bacterium]|jgi:hypothetical protein|nr:hypothetical protein [Planctomycetaceae bacterium]
MRLYSTANERGFDLKRLFICLSAKCRRDARDPLVSPAFLDRRHLACVPSDSQAKRPRSVGLACFSGSQAKLYLQRLFVCLAAKCRRDARDPVVAPAFQDRRHFAWVPSDSQAERPFVNERIKILEIPELF